MKPAWGRAFALVLMLLVASPSSAIQLRWAGGAQDLFVIDSTRTTLILDASDLPGGLPSEWRLLCVSDSTVVNVLADFSASGCSGEVARADSLAPPATPFDSTARQSLARFCSASASHANVAEYTVDILGGAHAKLKVVAMLPGSSTTVIESNEVLINGGVPEPFAPSILQVTTEHQSLEYGLTAIGSDLDGASEVAISDPDGSWSVPLLLVGKSQNQIVARASLAAPVPEGVASVASSPGALSGSMVLGEPEPELSLIAPAAGGCSAQFFEDYFTPGPGPLGYAIQPKDFALVPGFVDPATGRYGLHVFYIRHNYWRYSPFAAAPTPDLDEVNIGHAWTSDFGSWHGPAAGDRPDTLAIRTRIDQFDALHVWAPTVVRSGPVHHLFYTGVKRAQLITTNNTLQNMTVEQIGVATSTDLNTWNQEHTPVLSVVNVPWAKKVPYPGDPGQTLRDPFVMADPTTPGRWLMYFVSVDSLRYPRMAVGVATSNNLRNWTVAARPFEMTERRTSLSLGNTVESPHVFRKDGKWWMLYTSDKDQVFLLSYPGADPAANDTLTWNGPVHLRSVAEGRPAQLQYWHATEHLGSGQNEYLAAFNDNAISLEFMGVSAAANPAQDSLRLGCPAPSPIVEVKDAPGAAASARFQAPALIHAGREFKVEFGLRASGSVRLKLFDALGRERSILLAQDFVAGRSSARCMLGGQGGDHFSSGQYFLRLETPDGVVTRKAIVLR